MLEQSNTQTVYVVSWSVWNGEEISCGGFDWFLSEDHARVSFAKTVEEFSTDRARIRLVEAHIPSSFDDPDWMNAITDFLDMNLDALEDMTTTREYGWTALAVALTGIEHAQYPHEPGYLHDCPACESSCHCAEGNSECVWEGHESNTSRVVWS